MTNLAYGSILVISLLLTLIIPFIQRHIHNFSPVLYFVGLGVVAMGDLNGPAIAQDANESLLRRRGCLHPAETMHYGLPVPRGTGRLAPPLRRAATPAP